MTGLLNCTIPDKKEEGKINYSRMMMRGGSELEGLKVSIDANGDIKTVITEHTFRKSIHSTDRLVLETHN